MTAQYKAGPLHELKVDDAGYIEAAFAQLNVIDLDGDLTRPGAFPSTDVPMSAFGHASWGEALPVGKGAIAEEGDWAVFKGHLFLDTTAGRDTHSTLKELGPLAEFSYGYLPTQFSFGQENGQQVRYLERLDVFEVSPVLKGAGIGTHIRAIKGGAPGPEQPWSEHVSWVMDTNRAFLDHAKARVAMREAAGRKLSRADRDALREMAASLARFGDLSEPDEDPKAERAHITLMVELEKARSLGVPI